MALLAFEGFSWINTNADLAQRYIMNNQGNFGVSSNGGRFGQRCATLSGLANTNGAMEIAVAGTEFWIGGSFKDTVSGQGVALFSWYSVSGVEGSLAINDNTRVMTAYRGSNTIGTATLPFGMYNAWHWVEMHVKYDGTAGIVEVWIDGVSYMNLTSVNTKNGTNAALNGIAYGSVSGVNSSNTNMDCVYVCDLTGSAPYNGRLGEVRCDPLLPNSDAGPNNGTPSTGVNHFACADTLPWASTKFLTITNTSGQEELFGVGALGVSPSTIYAVKTYYIAEKSDAAAASLETVLNSGGTVVTGASHALSTLSFTQNPGGDIYVADPNTSAAWALAAVNAIKIGVEVP